MFLDISNFSFNLTKISLNRSHIQFAREYASESNIYIVSQFMDLGSVCTKHYSYCNRLVFLLFFLGFFLINNILYRIIFVQDALV